MNKNYHFIAIGGIGMSGLAKYLLEQGKTVSGSDIYDSKYISKLREMGANISIGHREENLPENSIVVVSTAIKEDNPELLKAKHLNMPIYHRSDLLEQLSRINGCFIGFSGTHGKTTTSGLASYLLAKAGLNPSYVVGGIVPELNTNAHYNTENYFIAELDESDGTITKYSPNILVINNLEADHLDFYKDGLNSLLTTFNSYISKLNNTKIIINADDLNLKNLKLNNSISFGIDNDANYRAIDIKFTNGMTKFSVTKNSEPLIDIEMQLPGKHNISNALAVISALDTAGIDIKLLEPYFNSFTGMGRRLQKVLEFDNITIYDDYAHHPTEISATLSAVKSANSDKRLVAVFQPHRYTRLKAFWQDFKSALSIADKIIVTDVYSASEDEIDGINSTEFIKGLNSAENFTGSMADVAKKLLPILNQGDIVIGLGAGTITDLAKEISNARKSVIMK